jgi:hypothetical protein
MAPGNYSDTQKRVLGVQDLDLARWTAGAKYDLTRFVEDGDIADKQIVENKARIKQLDEEIQRIEDGDPSHLLVQKRLQHQALLEKVRLVANLIDEKDKALHCE